MATGSPGNNRGRLRDLIERLPERGHHAEADHLETMIEEPRIEVEIRLRLRDAGKGGQ
jgi:hypothetical protein